ncbi:hypothetical protein [Streptomyces sp. NBC_01353]|uniref:hypothetical protein n=1 Tax=Streptomyces sp. NBC_01353 TaxID=2903835 RepID=UPI002E324BF6|nr:hypothetical protein [Streptomyces sp. NBC_01353]
MITLQLPQVPVPDAVAALIGSQLPKHVLLAEVEASNQAYLIGLCRTPLTRKARETCLADLARANKTLAKHDPRLIVRAGGAS